MKKQDNSSAAVMEDINPETYEFKTMEDYDRFNRWARKNGIPVRVPTEDFYKKVRVKFQRFDQPENVLKARLRTREIDWSGQLIPGKTYDLPKPVIKWLNKISEPIYAEVRVNDGTDTKTETKQVSERSKFSCQVLDFGE